MKKILALALLVSVVGVYAAEDENLVESHGSMLGNWKEHPYAALGGATTAGVLYVLLGGRDAQKGFTAAGVGAGAGLVSKAGIDKTFPGAPDTHLANFGKGAVGPVAAKYAPGLLNELSKRVLSPVSRMVTGSN